MASNPKTTVQAGDRWALIGASGTGKTTFSLQLLKSLWRWYRVPTYIVDTKPDDKLQKLWAGHATNNAPAPLSRFAVQRWEPLDKNGAEYDRFFKQILQHGTPAIVLVDEIANLATRAGQYPQGFEWLLKQARSKRITVIVGSQRAAKIPPDVLAQASHLVTFGLRNAHDRRTVAAELMLDKYAIEHPFGFYYSRVDRMLPAAYYSNSSDFFGFKP